MKLASAVAAAVLLLAATLAAAADPASFSSPPAARRQGDNVKIRFAVNQPTDVEVAVLDGRGKVLRHLAAGVLGGDHPPPAPLGAGLSQELTWDGKDDAGKPVATLPGTLPGPLTIRVRAGTATKFGKTIGFDPYRMPIIRSLATDEQGRLYVLFSPFHGGGGDPDVLRQFDRQGKYLKTIFPPPADLRPEQARGLSQVTGPGLDDGYLCPANYQPLFPRFFPVNSDIVLLGHRVTAGKLWLMSVSEGLRIMSIGADGSCPSDPLVGRLLPGWGERSSLARSGADFVGPISGAVAPDGKTLYLAGIQGATKGLELWKKGRVHAIDLAAPLAPVTAGNQPLLGLLAMKPLADVAVPAGAKVPEQAYSDWGAKMGMAAVHGLDVDLAGNVYACDRANDCVAVFDASGKPLGKLAVREPDQVAVHPKTGAVYVLTRGWKDKREAPVSLLKFAARNGKPVARFDFDQPAKKAPCLALDGASEPPGVWISNIGSPGGLLKLADQGDSFEKTVDWAERRQADGLDCVWLAWANPVTDEVFTNDGWAEEQRGLAARYDGKTGKRLPCNFTALDMAFDLDGNVYYSGLNTWTTPIWRLSPDLTPLPFPGSDNSKTTGRDVYGKYGWGHCQKGLAVARDGTLYAFHMKTWSEYTVVRWTPEGKAIAGFLTGSFFNTRSGGLKVDAAGNLYVGVPGWPKTCSPSYSSPVFFSGSSVVKCKPTAETCDDGYGKVPQPAGALEWQGPRACRWLSGAIAVYPYMSANGMSNDHIGCTCKEARFDLDLYGRLYIPNVLTYRVTLVDNAGSVICTAGHYGNADSQGPAAGSPLKKPAVPLGWPLTVGAAPDHGHVYVGDVVNSRIVRIDLTWAAEASCRIQPQ
jgi:hypothetical protein